MCLQSQGLLTNHFEETQQQGNNYKYVQSVH